MNVPVEQRVQAVACGRFVLGFAYGWARAALDMPPLTFVPNSPPWLMGAANLEGQIVPVVDLVPWLDATAPMHQPQTATQPSRNTHVLLGGRDGRALALRFDGLPLPLNRARHLPPPDAALLRALPPQLAALVRHALPMPAISASHPASEQQTAQEPGNCCWELDPEALLEALVADLRGLGSTPPPLQPDHNNHNGAHA